MKYVSIGLLFILACGIFNSHGQGARQINWRFKVKSVSPYEKDLQIKASLAPGWHLYSQFLKEGGPIPTRIYFEPHDGYRIIGMATEQGDPVKFYDDLFEMDIVWYSDEVEFTQRIELKETETLVKGKITYMVCDSQQCIPCEDPFLITVKQ